MRSRAFFFHPLLLALYPVAALLASNVDQIRPETALRSALIAAAGSLLLYALLFLALRRDPSRAPFQAPLVASFWLVLFFSYGHVYQLVEGQALGGFVYGKHRYLTLLWLAFFITGTFGIWRKAGQARALNQILNLVSVFLLAFPVFQIGVFAYRFNQAQSGEPRPLAEANETADGGVVSAEDTPDIYYIVLDGYSRADVLQDRYNLDIQPFMQDL